MQIAIDGSDDILYYLIATNGSGKEKE